MATKPPRGQDANDEKHDRMSDDGAGSFSSSWARFTPKTGFTCRTPDLDYGTQLHNSPLGDIPWYDKVYMILEKETRKAVTHTEHGLLLREVATGANACNSWLCVSHGNFTGFLNKKSRCYLGHDRKEIGSRIHANASRCDETECFIPRVHPRGGFQLFSSYGKQMRVLVKTSDGRIERAFHGDTLWVFEEV